MTASDQHAPLRGQPPGVQGADRRTRTRSTTAGRVAVVLAVLAVVGGVVMLIGGPAQSLHQQRDDDQKAQSVATDLTCFRYRSLEARVAAVQVTPEEIRTRASDLAIGARQARSDVAEAAQRLADQLNADQVQVGDAAWVALAGACQRA